MTLHRWIEGGDRPLQYWIAGLITLLLGLNSPLAAVAAIFHMMNHATFKASLFMGAGVIDHETGSRDIRRLSGLRRFMPVSARLAMVAAAAMAGVPLLNGFLSKEMFFAEALAVDGPAQSMDRALPYVATVAAMFSVTYSLRFIHGVFFGPDPVDLPRTPKEPPRWMRFPIELLLLACVVVGSFPREPSVRFSTLRCSRCSAPPRPNTAWPSGTVLEQVLLGSVTDAVLPRAGSDILVASGAPCIARRTRDQDDASLARTVIAGLPVKARTTKVLAVADGSAPPAGVEGCAWAARERHQVARG
jgi:hypothetical protein